MSGFGLPERSKGSIMGSIKAFFMAGALAVLVPGFAVAADLLPPPPPPQFEPPPPQYGNWYLRGDVGVGAASISDLRSTFDPGFFVPGDAFNSKTIGDSAFVDFGVGYQFNNWFHADVTGEYRTAANYHAIESFTMPTCPFASCFDNYNASVSSIVGLVNGYIDLGTWYGFTPYVGAGIGFTDNIVRGLTDVGVTEGGFGFASDHSSISLAWAAMAGISYAITPNLRLEMGYRYLNLGTVTGGAIQCQDTPFCGHEIQKFNLSSNDIRLGMRWMFADVAPPPPPRLPLVTKY
jgi:opacity protein-like surface antigen